MQFEKYSSCALLTQKETFQIITANAIAKELAKFRH